MLCTGWFSFSACVPTFSLWFPREIIEDVRANWIQSSVLCTWSFCSLARVCLMGWVFGLRAGFFTFSDREDPAAAGEAQS